MLHNLSALYTMQVSQHALYQAKLILLITFVLTLLKHVKTSAPSKCVVDLNKAVQRLASSVKLDKGPSITKNMQKYIAQTFKSTLCGF